MSVIVELTLPAHEFELGRILAMEGEARLVLETLVPIGDRPVPFFRVHGARSRFEEAVGEHPAVDTIQQVTSQNGEVLYALDWNPSDDTFFPGILAMDAHVLEASGAPQDWRFQLRFPSHEALGEFQAYCADASLPIDVEGVYNPTSPEAGPWYGLTSPQREMLTRAVTAGYYAIPRKISTQELADEFGISDQAVTERLRRGISTLVTNTLLARDEEEHNR